MFRRRDGLSPDVRALLDREGVVGAISVTTRARAVARARAALVAAPSAAQVIPSRQPHTIGWASAAGLIIVAALAGGAAAYELGARAHPPAAVWTPSLPPRAVARVIARPAELPAAVLPIPPPHSHAELVREELRLLKRARAAVARQDFASAMAPLVEHARRFKDGRLAEEREALRVRALAGLGRTREARRAIAAFEARFPRSPLLPAVEEMAADPSP